MSKIAASQPPTTAPRLIIVEDDAAIGALLSYNFEAEGFDVTLIARGDEAELILRETTPDLLLLDWMLPGLSGLELCRRLRLRGESKTLPIIMLTARGEEDERVRALNIGADDYLTKPFSVLELVARAKALLRRAKPDLLSDIITKGELQLDVQNHRLRRLGREIRLAPTEFRLLSHFMHNIGRVYSREQLLNRVWGLESEIDERTVDVHIGRLRRALSRRDERDPIRTIRGAGYAFDETF